MKTFVFVTFFVCAFFIKSGAGLTEALNLTPFIRNGTVNLARSLSRVDSSKFLGFKSYSGFIKVKEKYNSNQFFWLFPVEEKKMMKKPWIIWLGGGPGVTALKGLFELIGPISIEDGKVTVRNMTWASNYSLLFLDTPVGAGFSFTDCEHGYPDNEDDVGSQMYEFLLKFLQIFPELTRAPLFIAGQSYAGKFIPALGINIHRNKHTTDINLKGMAIGNGLIDPRNMMHYSKLCQSLGILDDEQVEHVKTLEQTIVRHIDNQRLTDASNIFNETIEYIKRCSEIDIYNIENDPRNSPHEFEAFLNRDDIRQLIHVGDTPFHLNNQLVYTKMLPDIMNTTRPLVEELLEHYGVMSYCGQLDVIIGYTTLRKMYKQMRWSKYQEYQKASRTLLRNQTSGAVIAYKKEGGNFLNVVVRRAGHNVPADQPEVAKYILDMFINKFM